MSHSETKKKSYHIMGFLKAVNTVNIFGQFLDHGIPLVGNCQVLCCLVHQDGYCLHMPRNQRKILYTPLLQLQKITSRLTWFNGECNGSLSNMFPTRAKNINTGLV